MNDANPKQQIADKIKNSTNILVTVSKNPNVDELSAAIGLTIMLNKLGKHATAVFSGAAPHAISFLDPEKTLENTVDSLRDFIIALDKEKADRLRYRVEDDVVRIFITPYRTKITQDDLEFTHGDFNVELVLALGVQNQDELDEAIAAHGKILHDATVATLSIRGQKSELGSIDWQDEQASSLCEMLVAISESIKGSDSLLDEQIATALLTGIVSATNRFSNDHTSPKAMTMAAQLMAAGANQQLIAAQLEDSNDISSEDAPVRNTDGSINLSEDSTEKIHDQEDVSSEKTQEKSVEDLGVMDVLHDGEEATPVLETKTQTPKEPEGLPYVEPATIEEHDRRNKKQASDDALDEALRKINATTPAVAPELVTQELEAETKKQAQKPRMSSAFNAMAQEAEQNRELEDALLSHDQSSGLQLESQPDVSTKGQTLQPIGGATLADIEAQVREEAKQSAAVPSLPVVDTASAARQEVENLFGAPAVPPPPAPPLPDFSTLPPLPPTDLSIPAPVTDTTVNQPEAAVQSPAAPAAPPTPDQFRIPGA